MKKVVHIVMRVLQGLLSIILFVGSVEMLKSVPIAGVVGMLGGVLVWPHVSNFGAKLIKKRWVTPVIGVLLFVAAVQIEEALMSLTPEQIAEREEKKAADEKERLGLAAKREQEKIEKERLKAESDARKAEKKAADEARGKAELREVQRQRRAREYVQGALKDPRSAEFRNQRGFCGEVNAKNSFGAYTGYKRFIAAAGDMVIIDGGGLSGNEFARLWNDACN